MSKFLKVIRVIFITPILPFAILYHDLFVSKKKENVFSSFFLVLVWFLFLTLGLFLIFPGYRQLIQNIMFIILGMYMIIVAYGHMKDIDIFDKKSYSEWYVDNWADGRLWKFLIGRDRAIKFTKRSLMFFSPILLILGFVAIFLGFYLIFR